MPKITLPLLDIINNHLDQNSTVVKKYIVKVTASELASWFQYEKNNKVGRHPFKVTSQSSIQISERIQRGKNENGYSLQEKSKVDDIKNTLLGIHETNKKVYLGSLVWNIRKKETNVLKSVTISEGIETPPEKELRITFDNIYLTDSAHRHFGIVEAYHEYRDDPSRYPNFNGDYEFTVEIYNLTNNDEQSLFNELNSKQKKITAARQKLLDITTALGKIKDLIIDYDMENQRIFYNNIELNSNMNTQHTLMTMSVFVSSIKEMFQKEVEEVYISSDVNEDLKDEIVEFYCDFFNELKENIEVTYKEYGEDKKIKPFENLYLQYIYPIENADYDDDEVLEKNLDEARMKAKNINTQFRKQDLTTHNITIKALSRVAKLIKRMSNWKLVIEQFQQDLILSNDGRFLQQTNNEIMSNYKNCTEAIAKVNLDGSLNIQVISSKVNDLYYYLCDKLNLKFKSNFTKILYENQDEIDFQNCIKISLTRETKFYIKYECIVADKLIEILSVENFKLSITPNDNWSKSKFTGSKVITAVTKDIDEGYEHQIYGNNLKRVIAKFEVTLPAYENINRIKDGLLFRIKSPYISLFEQEIDYQINLEENTSNE
jgi:hypothetical protein